MLIILHSRSKTTDIQDTLRSAASLIRAMSCLTAFTGAGVSVESGIPPFRGEIFYAHFGRAKPNRAHEVLAAWEERGILKTFITQNIDSVHLN